MSVLLASAPVNDDRKEEASQMGEIRTTVRLVNSIDQGMARRGQLASSNVRAYEADAMVDTGAVRSIIPRDVFQQLGLAVAYQYVVEYADGRQEAVDVTEPVCFELLGRQTTEESLVLGNEILIGQTTLEALDLLADCKNHRLIPNPAHPDRPVLKVK